MTPKCRETARLRGILTSVGYVQSRSYAVSNTNSNQPFLYYLFYMSKQRAFKNNNSKSLAPLAVSGRFGGKEETLKMTETERVAAVNVPYPAYAAQGYIVNPGLAGSFPWLSGHAALYDKYRFKRLRFRWVPIVSATSSGNIVMAFDHDPYDGLPSSSANMCSLSYYATASIWQEFQLDIPCDNVWRFCRSGPVGGDVKTYDIGALYVSSEGTSFVGVSGYVQVDYEIEFINKNIVNGVGGGNSFNTAFFLGDATVNAIGTGSNFIFNLPVSGYNSGGLYNVVTPNGAYNVFTLPKGRWLIRAKLQNNNTSTCIAQAGGTAVAGLTVNTQWSGPGSGFMEVYASSSGSDTFFITNTTAALNSTGQYCSLAFSLLD